MPRWPRWKLLFRLFNLCLLAVQCLMQLLVTCQRCPQGAHLNLPGGVVSERLPAGLALAAQCWEAQFWGRGMQVEVPGNDSSVNNVVIAPPDDVLQANLQLLNYTATNGFSRRRILLESPSDKHLTELPAGVTAALSEQQAFGSAGLQRGPGAAGLLHQDGQQAAKPHWHSRSALRKLLEVSLLKGPASAAAKQSSRP